jgi:hypothetical protein
VRHLVRAMNGGESRDGQQSQRQGCSGKLLHGQNVARPKPER